MSDLFLRHRDLRDELMDDPDLCEDRHRHALAGLRRLNWISGVSAAMDRRLRRMIQKLPNDQPVRVIDIASGSGDVPIELAKRARRRGREFDLTMVDISKLAGDIQQEAADRSRIKVRSIAADILSEPVTRESRGDLASEHWDIAMCSLFLHHLSSAKIVALLRTMSVLADQLLICDLQRSRFNLTCVNFAARIVTRSDVVHYDADASVRGALTSDELRQLAGEALGDDQFQVQTSFPCRMMLTSPKR